MDMTRNERQPAAPEARIARVAFRCPLCRLPLARLDGSLRCERRHTFDIARQGYVNFLLRQSDSLYQDKALFAARRAVYAAGFFDPLLAALRKRLPQNGMILDAGCGEGSMLSSLVKQTDGRFGIGLDNSRSAVRMASGAFGHLAFCVADLCDIPLADASMDAVLNVLTPANWSEFARVLAPGGLLLKVAPNAGHLNEVRALARKNPVSEHTEQDALYRLSRHFTDVETTVVRYTIPCDETLFRQVYSMTPLTSHATPSGAANGAAARDVTVDVTLIAARGGKSV